jgi:Putative Zn-dependent protease, contains TPR repeats
MINQDNFQANFSAGQILTRLGSPPKETLAYYQKAVQIKPSDSKALRELAGVYYDLNKKEESIRVFEDAISKEQDKIIKADLFFNLGVIHNQTGNYEAAEQSFDEAFFLNEDDYEAALGMANSYEGLGDNFYNGAEGFIKDNQEASKWYRKAEKKIKAVMIIDIDNKDTYKKKLKLIRYKRDISEENR